MHYIFFFIIGSIYAHPNQLVAGPEAHERHTGTAVQTQAASAGSDTTLLIYDENSPYFLVSDSANNCYAVRFTPLAYPFTVSEIGFYISSLGYYKAPFDIKIFRERDGRPDSVWATLFNVSATKPDSFNWFDVSIASIVVDSSDFFAGICFKTDFSPYVGTDSAVPLNDRSWSFYQNTWSNFDELEPPWSDSMDLMIRARSITATGIADTPIPATDFRILTTIPNPFRRRTEITFSIPASTHVQLKIYDPAGALIRTLVAGSKPAGTHSVIWDGRDTKGNSLPAGIYFYRLTTQTATVIQKVVLVR
jgi:hypothetical protein